MSHIRLRKHLLEQTYKALWPQDIAPVELADIDPRHAHAVLDAAFPNLIAPCDDWHGNLLADAEYDPTLCVAAVTESGEIAGFIQCWTSSFIKDLAVDASFRRRGIGTALMNHAFGLFAARNQTHVDLKVETGELAARRLYERLGMVEVSD